MDKHHIEHKAVIHTTHGTSRADQLKELNASAKRMLDTSVKEAPKTCPLRKGGACVGSRCALYINERCAVVPIVQHVTSTRGKMCPLSGLNCGDHCAAYRGGCSFASGGIP